MNHHYKQEHKKLSCTVSDVECKNTVTRKCICIRCDNEPEYAFYTCQDHVLECGARHLRIYDRTPEWTLIQAPSIVDLIPEKTIGSKKIADMVIDCIKCGKPCALLNDVIPTDELCPWCRAEQSPEIIKLWLEDWRRPQPKTIKKTYEAPRLKKMLRIFKNIAFICLGSSKLQLKDNWNGAKQW